MCTRKFVEGLEELLGIIRYVCYRQKRAMIATMNKTAIAKQVGTRIVVTGRGPKRVHGVEIEAMSGPAKVAVTVATDLS
jgi:hypothetical protein